MPSINTSDITRASDSTYFVDIACVNKFILTYLLEWLMLLNVEKFKVMHIGHNDNKSVYEMNGVILEG